MGSDPSSTQATVPVDGQSFRVHRVPLDSRNDAPTSMCPSLSVSSLSKISGFLSSKIGTLEPGSCFSLQAADLGYLLGIICFCATQRYESFL